MKPLVKSRLVWVLAAVVAAQLALYLRRYLPAEQAALLSDELVATLCAALGIGGIGLRVQDKRRRLVTAGTMLERAAARQAGDSASGAASVRAKAKRSSAGLLALWLLGCSTPQTCGVRVTGEPSRDVATGAPLYTLRCGTRTLWRGVCGEPTVRGRVLYCDGVPAVRLDGGPVEVTP